MRQDIGIPRHVDDLTAGWLSEAFRVGAGGAATPTVASVAAERIGVGIGIMSESWRLTLTYQTPTTEFPSTVVVKLASPYEGNRAHGVNLGLYEAETRFYGGMAGSTATRKPHCYLARKDPAGADFVIIMEDLSRLRMVDQFEGMSADEADRAVNALAELHGSWWGKVQTPEWEWIPSVVHARIEAMAALWPQLWPIFLERFGDALPAGGEAVGVFVRDNYWPLMQQLAIGPWTLLHMDFRCENLLFDEPGSSQGVVVLDWQSIGRGSGSYDLSYLLGGSLRTEDRRVWEESLVRQYDEVLKGMGVEDHSYQAIWDGYRLAHLVGGTATVVLTGASTDLGNERGVELISTMTARHFAAAVDLDGVALASAGARSARR